jgi:hypothetical protein
LINGGQGVLSQGIETFMPRYDEFLRYGMDYEEALWDNSAVKCALFLLEVKMLDKKHMHFKRISFPNVIHTHMSIGKYPNKSRVQRFPHYPSPVVFQHILTYLPTFQTM